MCLLRPACEHQWRVSLCVYAIHQAIFLLRRGFVARGLRRAAGDVPVCSACGRVRQQQLAELQLCCLQIRIEGWTVVVMMVFVVVVLLIVLAVVVVVVDSCKRIETTTQA